MKRHRFRGFEENIFKIRGICGIAFWQENLQTGFWRAIPARASAISIDN
jgi:hypothetical protein